MPLTSKGRKIKAAMTSQYGEKKGTSVFYASKNAGKISGVDASGSSVNGVGAESWVGNPKNTTGYKISTDGIRKAARHWRDQVSATVPSPKVGQTQQIGDEGSTSVPSITPSQTSSSSMPSMPTDSWRRVKKDSAGKDIRQFTLGQLWGARQDGKSGAGQTYSGKAAKFEVRASGVKRIRRALGRVKTGVK